MAAAEVFVLCRSGVEWNEIVAVYTNWQHAQRAQQRHEIRRISSRDVMDQLSRYVIERHQIRGGEHGRS